MEELLRRLLIERYPINFDADDDLIDSRITYVNDDKKMILDAIDKVTEAYLKADEDDSRAYIVQKINEITHTKDNNSYKQAIFNILDLFHDTNDETKYDFESNARIYNKLHAILGDGLRIEY